MKKLRPRLTFANVVSCLALFVALGGGAYAATRLAKNSVGTKQIKKRAVTPAKLSPAATAALSGKPGEKGEKGAPGQSALEALHSGQTIAGSWALGAPTGSEGVAYEAVTLPVSAPRPLNSEHVVVANFDDEPGDGCTGTPEAPVAAPGFVCAYVKDSVHVESAEGVGAVGVSSNPKPDDGTDSGFLLILSGFGAPWHGTGTWAYTAP